MNDRFHGFFGSPSRELAALREAASVFGAEGAAPGFTLTASWGPRADSPSRVADALVRTARRLQELDGRLDVAFRDRRYVFSSTAETVLDHARDHSVDRMVRRMAASSRDGIAEPLVPAVPLLGAATSLVAHLDSGSPCARLRVHAGHQAPPDAVNHVRLELDASHFLLPDKPLVLRVIEALVDVWSPDIAGLHAGGAERLPRHPGAGGWPGSAKAPACPRPCSGAGLPHCPAPARRCSAAACGSGRGTRRPCC